MSPLLGRLRRLMGAAPERAPDVSPSDESLDAPDPDAEPKRRRRGRRVGRGRNGGATDAPVNGTTATADLSPASANGNGRGPTAERRAEETSGARAAGPTERRAGGRDERRPRTYRTPRYLLDEPLPEDIAFRAPSEGGDSSILPGRRRPPSGPRATARILMPSSRYFSVFRAPASTEQDPEAIREEARRSIQPITRVEPDDREPAVTTTSEATPASETAAPGTEALPHKPRRRGRRGGRGRSRDAASAAVTAETTDSEREAEAVLVEDESEEDGALAAPEAVSAAGRERARSRTTRVRRERVAPIPEAFRALGIGETSLETLASFGFAEPTPIQERSIPALLAGRDMVGVAQTGSGKTIAFGVPMMERIDPSQPEVQGLVLVPTRELAQQVLDVISDLADPFGMKAVGLLGGHALKRDFQALEDRPQIVVGTPGRVIDHLRRGTLSLSHVSYAVLDEADEMLDIGFLPDITRILSRTPRKRQTALFSATMPTSIKRLVHRYMNDPETVTVDAELSTVDSIEQVYFEVAERDKLKGLSELVRRELKGRTLVFSRTRRGVDRLADRLGAAGIRVGALHGDMDQRRRDNVVAQFRRGELDVLVATNVAARGLDIPEITHVVNFDVPQNAEEYVHRIGRTGRAGREGKAITFVCEYDVAPFDTLLQQFGDKLRKERLELYD